MKLRKKDKKVKTIFITGATGNIGAKIVEYLISDQMVKEIIVLIRAKNNKDALHRIKTTLLQIEPNLCLKLIAEKVKVECGDLSKSKLGLSQNDYKYIINNTTSIIHSAASTKFDAPIETARKINVDGTRNLFLLAQEIFDKKRLDGIAHISTAYVNGHSVMPIFETDLVENQKFDNNYEQSKWESEKLIRKEFSHLPYCIFRPSIVVGDSQTGRTVNYNVLYPFVRYLYSGLISMLPGRSKTKLDIVPVDYVAKSVIKILLQSDSFAQKTFHLIAGADCLTSIKEIIHITSNNKSARNKFRFIPFYLFLLIKPLLSVKTMKLCKLFEAYIPYMQQTYHFNSENTISSLHKSMDEFTCNRDFVSRNIIFYTNSNWGKNKISA